MTKIVTMSSHISVYRIQYTVKIGDHIMVNHLRTHLLIEPNNQTFSVGIVTFDRTVLELNSKKSLRWGCYGFDLQHLFFYHKFPNSLR